MKSKIFKWNEKENTISFNVEKDRNMMVNATEMAKVFGAEVARFMENKGTKEFIASCLKTRNSAFLNGENESNPDLKNQNSGFLNGENESNSDLKTAISPFLNIEKEEDLYTSKQKTGTWMHEILAMKFAAWLDPDFEVWVYFTVREILFESYREEEETLRTIAGIQDQITEKEKELKNLPILKEIENLRKSEQKEKRKFELHKKVRISGFRTIFSEKEMEGKENDPK